MGEAQGGTMVDTSSEAFARRLGNLLIATRERRGVRHRNLVAASGNRFTRFDLKAIEAGTMQLDDIIIDDVVELYQADVGAILPMRLPVVVSPGLLTAGGVSTSFAPGDSLSLLRSYLLLIRSMRRQKNAPAVVLRREDVEAIATYLGESGEGLVMRLGALMGATRTQRTAMASLFTSGAVVIGLVGSVAAGGSSGEVGRSSNAPTTTITATYAGPSATTTASEGTVGSSTSVIFTAVEIPVGQGAAVPTAINDAADVAGVAADAAGVAEDGASSTPVVVAVVADATVNATANSTASSTAIPTAISTAIEPPPTTPDPSVADDATLAGLDPSTLAYTAVADPIVFVLDPAVIDVAEPPVSSTTVVAEVETGLPPVVSS